MSDLSARGSQLLTDAPMAPYIDAHFERVGDPDYIGLAIAENKLMWDVLGPRLKAPRSPEPHAIGYDEMIGNRALRTQIAALLERTWVGRPIAADHVAVLAGAGSVLEILFYTLADPGDGVLVPTPSYAGFWSDLETRDGLRIVPVPTEVADGFRLTTGMLDRAVETAGRPIAALLLTNPSNPLGTIAPPEEMTELVAWAADLDLHVVLDEIYALSVHDETPFRSAAAGGLPHHAHLVWAFSKDFSMSGLRCGVLVTENEDVMRAVGGLGYWAAVSGDTQSLLTELLADRGWVDGYLTAMRERLAVAYRAVCEALAGIGVPHTPASAGFFVYADLRAFLSEPTWEGEHALWRAIVGQANVNVTPGSACRAPEPGFMRICFATEPPARVTEAVQRIGRVLA
jgi:aspartate/methionine/tyrosine aminotransferase